MAKNIQASALMFHIKVGFVFFVCMYNCPLYKKYQKVI